MTTLIRCDSAAPVPVPFHAVPTVEPLEVQHETPNDVHHGEYLRWGALRRRHQQPDPAHLAAQKRHFEGFTKRYHIHRLVYYESHPTMKDAIRREKYIKHQNRAYKVKLIVGDNPQWWDRYPALIGDE